MIVPNDLLRFLVNYVHAQTVDTRCGGVWPGDEAKLIQFHNPSSVSTLKNGSLGLHST